MKVLLTGGTGFIGRSMLKKLVQAGLEVRLLLKPSRTSPSLPLGMPIEVTVCSLSDIRGIRAALGGVDAIIHLASHERFGSRHYDPDGEISGTRNLAEAASETGIQRFIFLSHLGANPTSAYTVLRTKAIAEEHVRKCGVPHTIIRSSLIYGPGDQFTTSIATQLALTPLIFLLPGHGDTLVQPLGVNDLSTAIAWALDEPGTLEQTYEIGGPEFLSFKQVVELVMASTKMRRFTISLQPPYLRFGAWLMERVLPYSPITTFWVDYLAVNRTTDLGSLPRAFGLQPARMESNLEFLQGRHWIREFLSHQFHRERGVV